MLQRSVLSMRAFGHFIIASYGGSSFTGPPCYSSRAGAPAFGGSRILEWDSAIIMGNLHILVLQQRIHNHSHHIHIKSPPL